MKILINMCFLIMLSSCSFNSVQLDSLKKLITEDTNDGPKPNWTVEWIGINSKVFAINNRNYIYFADYDDKFIEFDGWQVTKINGFLPENRNIEIAIKQNETIFYENRAQIYNANCESWEKSSSQENGIIKFSQYCNGYNPSQTYTNIIVINDLGLIIGLKYKIHPNYPQISIIMDDYNGHKF